ncbi:TetR/AcrR family transcriptional regulator [Pseudonocardia spinosispora]|uniref:TetR/AcrR family transcriptional regulator n=1 Tax=Pseudonocardia spinosispora TaxID=103441 RepID=UPI00055F638C|nr:TetR/AcrR family transcriptional regulator [Pseudonocardia spinosispora]
MPRLDPEQRRAQLLRIGLELLTEQSLDELSTDEVARRAGISRGLLFHYFASKREFHEAVVRRACDDFVAATAPDAQESSSVDEWLAAGLMRFVDYVWEHRQVYLALVRGAPGSNPIAARIVDATRRQVAERMLDYHRRAGLPVGDRLEITALAWTAYAEEATVNWPTEGPDARAELADYLRASLTRLLAP